jgi:hypothetical protein
VFELVLVKGNGKFALEIGRAEEVELVFLYRRQGSENGTEGQLTWAHLLSILWMARNEPDVKWSWV